MSGGCESSSKVEGVSEKIGTSGFSRERNEAGENCDYGHSTDMAIVVKITLCLWEEWAF